MKLELSAQAVGDHQTIPRVLKKPLCLVHSFLEDDGFFRNKIIVLVHMKSHLVVSILGGDSSKFFPEINNDLSATPVQFANGEDGNKSEARAGNARARLATLVCVVHLL